MLLWGWPYLEADFFRYYNLDLYDLIWKEEISTRRFSVLKNGLPPDSAWARFIMNEENYELAKNFT